jgi:hypothetical protein
VIEVALSAAVSLHRVEPQLERRDPLRSIRAADRCVHAPLHRERRALDQLGQVVDAVERVEVGHAARIGHGDHAVELPVVARRQRDPLLVREAPHDVRRNGAAEMSVQLRESFFEHRGQSTVAP